MILSKQKYCLLLNGVSTESQKPTSVLQTKRAFKADMESYIPLETAAIFFLANLFLKQCIG